MSVNARRLVYGLLAALGVLLTVPLTVRSRAWRARMGTGDLELDTVLEISGGLPLALLALLGIVLAFGFLYAALSVGYPRAWAPIENDRILCRRCGEEIGFGVRRCPNCDQQLVW